MADVDEPLARYVDPYPRWYTPVKWLLPISLAMLSGLTVALAIMGILPIPFALGKVAWLPAIYASLDTMKAVAMVGGAITAVSAVVGLASSFVLRATVLFQANELRGTQGQNAQQKIKELTRTIVAVEEENRLLREMQQHKPANDSQDSDSSDSHVVEVSRSRSQPLLRRRRPREEEADAPNSIQSDDQEELSQSSSEEEEEVVAPKPKRKTRGSKK